MLTIFLSCVGLWKIFTFYATYYNVSSFYIYEYLHICHDFCNQEKKINVSVAQSLESVEGKCRSLVQIH